MAILMAALAFPGLAAAQEASFGFQVTVLHTSPDGKVGPKAKRFHRLLGRRVKYGGIRVVKSKATRVKVNNIGGIKLPDGSHFQFRPIDGGGPGALVAVDMGQTQGDFRLPAGKPLILGGSSWRGGKLVVVLELTE